MLSILAENSHKNEHSKLELADLATPSALDSAPVSEMHIG
jgi:hypothetical protein